MAEIVGTPSLNKVLAIGADANSVDITGLPSPATSTSATNKSYVDGTVSTKENSITAGTTAQYWRGDKTWQTLDTSVVSENGNLYYTTSRFDTRFGSKTTSDLAEGSNLYYTAARFNAAFAAKSTSDLAEGSNLYYTDVRADARITLQKGAVNGIATLDSGGKIPTTQLPAIAITNTFVVASQAAMLALTAETGDVAVRTDVDESYILQGTDPTILGDWVKLLIPTDSVLSVNGQTGAVVLTTSDITEGTNLYYTNARGIASTLTGYTSGAGTITSADTILGAIQKLNGNIAAIGPTTGFTINRAMVSNASGVLAVSTVSTTQLQYLSSATGTTGTTSSNLVFSTSPTLVTPVLGAATATSLKIGTGSPTSPLHIHATPATNAAHILIEDLTGTNSTFIEFKDAAGTPNRWLLGTGFTTHTDGVFFLYDRRQSADRLRVDTNGIVSINGAAANKAILEVNGNVNLNNVYYPTTAALNPMYTIFRNGGTSYGMKLQYDTSTLFGTMIFSPAPSNFVSLGVCTGTGTTDNDFISQVYLDSLSGNLGVRTTLGEIQGANAATFTARQTNVNSAAIAPGWIAGSFGGNGGTGNVVVMGGYNNSAVIGAHNYALSAWTDLYINPAGGKVFVGPVSSNNALFEIGGGAVAGSALSTQFVCEAPNLGTTAGNENIIASFALNTGNTSSLAVSSYRSVSGSDWQSASMGLSMNVDNTVRPSTVGASSSLWFNSSNISIGPTPFNAEGGGNFVVSGSTSSAANTVFATIINTGSGGSSIDFYSSSTGGYLGPSVGLSWSAVPFIFSIEGSEVMRISTNGCVGIFDNSADAFLHIGAGTTSFAPLKFTSGSLLTTPQAGAVEFSTDSLYITRTTNTTRQKINGLRTVLIRVVDSATNVATGTTIGGDVEIPITGVIASIGAYVDTAGTTGTMTVDVNKNGTTLMSSTKITIDSTEKSSRTAATAPVLTTTSITAGDVITIDIDAIQTTPAKGLTVRLEIIEQ